MGIFDDVRFVTASTAATTCYLAAPQFATVAATAGFLCGWQLGGFIRNRKAGDLVIKGDIKENGSFANPLTKNGSLKWTEFERVANVLSQKNEAFYVDNFRFSKIIKNKVNFINKQRAKKIEKKELFMKYSNLKKGSLIVGSMGSGKTEFLNNIIVQWIDTNRRIIFNDRKGEFVSWFYNEKKDYIINYLDKRGVYWDFFEDIENGLETETVYNFFSAFFEARTGENKDKFWQSKAATRFKEIFNLILIEENINNKMELLALKLMKYLKEEKADKTEQSVAATLEEAVEIFFRFAFMRKNGNKKFLVTKFFNSNEDKNSKIFLLTTANVSKQITPFLTALLDVVFRYQMTIFENAKEKDFVLYVLDEYLTFFNKMSEDLRTTLHTTARAYGILLLPTIQYLPHDQNLKQDLIGSVKNLFIFSCADIQTIQDVKNFIGKSKVVSLKKLDKKIEGEDKEEFLIDDNQLKNQKPGEHITYIRDQNVLYKGYTKQVKVKNLNEKYIYNNQSKDFIIFKKTLEEKALEENF